MSVEDSTRNNAGDTDEFRTASRGQPAPLGFSHMDPEDLELLAAKPEVRDVCFDFFANFAL